MKKKKNNNNNNNVVNLFEIKKERKKESFMSEQIKAIVAMFVDSNDNGWMNEFNEHPNPRIRTRT